MGGHRGLFRGGPEQSAGTKEPEEDEVMPSLKPSSPTGVDVQMALQMMTQALDVMRAG